MHRSPADDRILNALRDLSISSDITDPLRRLMDRVEERDPFMRGHSERVRALSAAVGRAMGFAPCELEVLETGALLHDIGKIAISAALLTKPGALSPAELETIQRHPLLGARLLDASACAEVPPVAKAATFAKASADKTADKVPWLAGCLAIVELHHERPDGGGYPHGLRGDDIPPLARIVHVADAFDAMSSARAYRPARQMAEAVSELWRHRSSQFDPLVVTALLDTIGTA